jgi:glutamate--cysteine ligase
MPNSKSATGPTSLKNQIAHAVFEKRREVSDWFESRFRETPPAFYCSVDLRDSGDKIAPVDCNLFPAGFNNICEIDLGCAPGIFKEQIGKMASILGSSAPEKILIVPENHTENRFYLENLHHLSKILEEAGFETAFGRYGTDQQEYTLKSASEQTIHELPLLINHGRANLSNGFDPDWILLNNDFSAGRPDGLFGLSQPVMPSPELGWFKRKKSDHFKHYNLLAGEFAGLIGIDPWRIQIGSSPIEGVDFGTDAGLDRVISESERMLDSVKAEYAKRGMERKPALFIKNDSGTYGMGIMVIHSIEELKTMNRRTRNKMSMGKNKSRIDRVLIQEGIPTTLTTDGSTSEPVVYMMGSELIGGFIRANSERDDMDNLNSQGMFFKKLCFKDLSDSLNDGNSEEFPHLEAVYGVIGKLSALAAARELRDTQAK